MHGSAFGSIGGCRIEGEHIGHSVEFALLEAFAHICAEHWPKRIRHGLLGLQIGIDKGSFALSVETLVIEVFCGFVVDRHGEILVKLHRFGVEYLATMRGIGRRLPIILLIVGEQCHPVGVGQLVGLCGGNRHGHQYERHQQHNNDNGG